MGVQVHNALFFQRDSQSLYRCACFGWTHLKRHCLQAEQFSSKISSIFDHRVRDSSLIESYYQVGRLVPLDIRTVILGGRSLTAHLVKAPALAMAFVSPLLHKLASVVVRPTWTMVMN